MQLILIKINLPKKIHGERKEKSAQNKIPIRTLQLTQVKNVKKFTNQQIILKALDFLKSIKIAK